MDGEGPYLYGFLRRLGPADPRAVHGRRVDEAVDGVMDGLLLGVIMV
jgi:hypothetical protein